MKTNKRIEREGEKKIEIQFKCKRMSRKRAKLNNQSSGSKRMLVLFLFLSMSYQQSRTIHTLMEMDVFECFSRKRQHVNSKENIDKIYSIQSNSFDREKERR